MTEGGRRADVGGEGVDEDVEVRMRTVRGRRGRLGLVVGFRGVVVTVAEGKRIGVVLLEVLVRGRVGWGRLAFRDCDGSMGVQSVLVRRFGRMLDWGVTAGKSE